MFTSALRFAVLAAAAVNLTFAAEKPDLSGNWKIDLNNSDFGGAPPPESFRRSIEHAEPSVVLTDEQVSALGPDKAVRKYTTDGKETTYQWMGNEVKSAAHWDGSTLVIIGKLNAGGTDLVVTKFDHCLLGRQDLDRERQNRRGGERRRRLPDRSGQTIAAISSSYNYLKEKNPYYRIYHLTLLKPVTETNRIE